MSFLSLEFSWLSKLSKYSFYLCSTFSSSISISTVLLLITRTCSTSVLCLFLCFAILNNFFPLLCFQFFIQFLVCLISCLSQFSPSLFSCSFIGQLACIISDDIQFLFCFYLILQFLLAFLVPPPPLLSTCCANFSRCFTQFHFGNAPYHLSYSLPVFLSTKYCVVNYFHYEFFHLFISFRLTLFVLHFRVF